jgi:hypothetical protein
MSTLTILPYLIPNYGSVLRCNECFQEIGKKNNIFFNNTNWEYFDNNKLLRDRALTKKSHALLSLSDNCFVTWPYYRYIIFKMNRIIDRTDAFIIETERNGNCYECGYLKLDYFNNFKWMLIYGALMILMSGVSTGCFAYHHKFAQLIFAIFAIIFNTCGVAFYMNNEYILFRRQKLHSAKGYHRFLGVILSLMIVYNCFLMLKW